MSLEYGDVKLDRTSRSEVLEVVQYGRTTYTRNKINDLSPISCVTSPLAIFWRRQNIAKGEKQLANTEKTIKLDKLVGLLRRSISRTAEFAQEFQISDKRSHQHRSGCHISESAKTVAIHQARSFHYLAPDARTAAGLSKTLTLGACRSARSLWNLG